MRFIFILSTTAIVSVLAVPSASIVSFNSAPSASIVSFKSVPSASIVSFKSAPSASSVSFQSAPSAKIVSLQPAPSPSSSALSANPSTNAREEAWARMRLALPDGILQQEIKEEPILPYKHLEFTEHIKIALLPPSQQAEMNRINDAVHAEKDFEVVAQPSGRRYKKYTGNDASKSVDVIDSNGVQQKKLVGMDLNGQMRYLEIPYYNRAST